jgi:hypothetical protein
MKKVLLLCVIAMISTAMWAQKIDFNLPGRQASQVTETGYTPWAVTTGVQESLVPDSTKALKITIANGPNSAGKTLRSNWWKDGVNKYSKLVGDGVAVYGLAADGNTPQLQAGSAEITLTLSGLTAGKHSLLAYHNNTDGYNGPKVDVYVDDVKTVEGVAQTSRAMKPSESGQSYVTFNAQDGKDVVISYRTVPDASVDYTQGYNTTTVFINALVFDEPNPLTTALDPYPDNLDIHVDADNGSTVMKWTAATTAVKHHIYFGTSADAMTLLAVQTDTSLVKNGLHSLDTYYWRVDEEDAAGNIYKGETWMFRPRHLAFPGAEGYGRYATGGRGGVVYHVTSLDDDADAPQPGTFRYGITKVNGPRTIVFDVGGVIDLKGRLTCSDPFVTVAGQTAPGNGIMFRSCPFGMATEGITRFVRMRLGHKAVEGNSGLDGMGMAGNDYAIMDHCSISWTIDEAFSSRNAKNVTLQHTLISEALNVAGHPNYPSGTAHGYAATIGGDTGSYHHNLLAHNEGRNWSMSGGLDGSGAYAGHHDMFNNVCYNWGGRACDGGTHEGNFVNNYYKMGAATTQKILLNAQLEGTGTGSQSYYVSGNIRVNKDGSKTQDKLKDTYEYNTSNEQVVNWTVFQDKPFFPSYADIESAESAYKNVLSDVGCNMPVLDNHDTRMVNETIAGTTTTVGSKSGKPGLIDSEEDKGCEGFTGLNISTATREANFDTDQDGMPDWWENAKGLNVNVADNNGDPDQDGYTNLEDYLNWMAEPHFIINKGGNIAITMKDYFAGYTNNPSYEIGSVNNMSYESDDNGVCTFTPSADFTGFITMKITATDDDKVGSLTRNFNFYVSSDITGINEINGDGADGTKRYEVYNVSGVKLIGNAKNASLAGLAPGLYVVKTLKGSTVVSVSTVVHK